MAFTPPGYTVDFCCTFIPFCARFMLRLFTNRDSGSHMGGAGVKISQTPHIFPPRFAVSRTFSSIRWLYGTYVDAPSCV